MNLSPRRREEPEINLTPLIDVVFLMLIFFMVSTTFLHEADLQISLPQAAEEPVPTADRPVEITINQQGSVFIDGRPLVNAQADTLARGLRNAIGERDPGQVRVVIRADARSEHQHVVTALDAAGRVGLRQVGIATVPGEE